MKVTKAQAQANRAQIIETASALFRERGYDGVGVVELMSAAGFTHGGFYNHFRSKAELMAESAVCGFAQTSAKTEGADIIEFVRQYLSREHRDSPGEGCTLAALSGDAARQPEPVRAAFAEGFEDLLQALSAKDADLSERAQGHVRANRIDAIARMVGAIVLSRACPDNSPLADEILDACRSAAIAQTSCKTGKERK